MSIPGRDSGRCSSARSPSAASPAWQRYYEQPDQRDLPKKGRCFDNLIGLAIPAFVDAQGRSGHAGAPAGRRLRPSAGLRGRSRASRSSLARRPSTPGQAAHLGGGGRGELPDEVGEHRRLGRTTARFRAAGPLFPVAPKTVRICVFRTPPNRLRGRELRPRLPSRCVPDPAAAPGAHRPRAEARLPEAAHVRGSSQKPGLGSECRARRLLPRRASRSHGRHRRTRCGQRDPRRMMRGALCTAVVAAAVICGGAAASPHHAVTRAEARARLGRLLGVKPQQMWRAWTAVGASSVVLEWRAYAPHAQDSGRRRPCRRHSRSLLPRPSGRLGGHRRGWADRGRLHPDAASSRSAAALDRASPLRSSRLSQTIRRWSALVAASRPAEDRPGQGDLEAAELGRPQGQAAGHLARPVPAWRTAASASRGWR